MSSRTRTALGVATVMALSLGIAIPANAAAAPKFVAADCFNAKKTPRSMILACGDGTLILRQLDWNSWGGKVARGHGTAHINLCRPSCAEGRAVRRSVRVRVRKARPCAAEGGRLFYRTIVLRFRSDPPEGLGRRQRRSLPCPLG